MPARDGAVPEPGDRNPDAQTITSNSYSLPPARMPFREIPSMPFPSVSTSCTWGWLKAGRYSSWNCERSATATERIPGMATHARPFAPTRIPSLQFCSSLRVFHSSRYPGSCSLRDWLINGVHFGNMLVGIFRSDMMAWTAHQCGEARHFCPGITNKIDRRL